MHAWHAWDSAPIEVLDGGRVYTPHKAVRRYTDHLIDHLAQVEAIVSMREARLNRWQESHITTPADHALFTTQDAREAEERINRLTDVFVSRLSALTPVQWAMEDAEWSVVDIVEHVATPWYGEQVGDLSTPI